MARVSYSQNDKPVLLSTARQQGFFSLVFQGVGQAHLAEKAGQIPLAYFNEFCLYWSDAGYEGARNVWEYFFEPLSELKIEDVISAPLGELERLTPDDFGRLCEGTNITATNKYPMVIEYRSPLGVFAERKFVHGLLQKHLKLRSHVKQKREDFHKAYFAGRHVLGVHFRGLEKTTGHMVDWIIRRNQGGPPDTRAHYFLQMRRYMKRHPDAGIFIATDSHDFLEQAKAEFGNAVFSREAVRLPKETEAVGLHFSELAKVNGPRLAEEVLLDALLLAQTDYFIHGISNVSNAVLFFNPQLRHIDLDIRYGRIHVYLRREAYRWMFRLAPGVAQWIEQLENRTRFANLTKGK